MRCALLLLPILAFAQTGAPDVARAAAEELAQGRHAEMRARFTAQMLDAVPEDGLRNIARSFFADAGAFTGVGSPTCSPVREFQSCVVPIQFASETVPVRLTVTGDGKIAGLFRVLEGANLAWFLALPAILFSITGFVMHHQPLLRADMFFGVRASAQFRQSVEGRDLLTKYRRLNLGLAAAALLLSYTALQSWGIPAGMFIYGVGMFAAHLHARSRIPRVEAAPGPRTASLVAGSLLPSWTHALWLVPPLIVAGTVWYLSTHWDSIPDSFPVHWGPSGKPDRWRTKSFGSVFLMPAIGASTLVLVYGLTGMTLFGARRTASTSAMLRAFSFSMLGVATAISILSAVIGLNTLSSTPNRLPIAMPLIVIFPVVILLISVLPMLRASNQAAPEDDPTPDECWRLGGKFYVNANDPAWMVRNRIGLGFSPNLGHPGVRVVAPLLIGQMGVVILYMLTT